MYILYSRVATRTAVLKARALCLTAVYDAIMLVISRLESIVVALSLRWHPVGAPVGERRGAAAVRAAERINSCEHAAKHVPSNTRQGE